MNTTQITKFRPRRLAQALALALSLPLSVSAFAQSENEDGSEDENARQMERVEVVGSRIKRAEVEGPAPVTVITADQILREGFNTVYDALQTLNQNTGWSQGDVFGSVGGFTPNASVINLRGMGPGRTLLLINGRRANDYPFPYNGRSNFQNFNNIPAAAVERIEILAGGASAIYGSDAVAGVINVVLKTNFDGDVAKLLFQTSTRGGKDTADFQWVGGRTSDRWSLTYAVEKYYAQPLHAFQRDFMDSAEDNPSPPGVNGARGVGGYQPPIGIQLRGIGVPAAGSYLQPAGYDCSGSPNYRPWDYTSSATGAPLGPGCGFDTWLAQRSVTNGNDDLSGYLYGTLDFENGMQGWASFMAYRSNARNSTGTEQWFGGPQPNAVHYDPQFGIRVLPIRVLSAENYGGIKGTYQRFEETSYDLAFGLRGTFADRFDWDFTIGGSRYTIDRERPRLTVEGATNYFLGSRLGTTGVGEFAGLAGIPNGVPVYALNLDRFYGPISVQDYLAMSTLVKYDASSQNRAASFVVSGDLFDLPAGPVGFATVIEASDQEYDLNSDRRILPDVRQIYNLTGTGGGGERSRYAFGVEAKVPITSMLSLSLAGRLDKYDDITDVDWARTWNAGLEFRPFENLLVRGSYSTSFKAPDMHYVFSERSGAFQGVVDFFRCLQDGIEPGACSGSGPNYNYSAFVTSQGQPSLQEETGKSWTAGFVWDVLDNLSVSADYYEIELENEVVVQSAGAIINAQYGCATGFYPNGAPFPYASGSDYCNASIARIIRGADGRIEEVRSGPINQAFRGTKGVDATVSYRLDTDNYGRFVYSLSWSHVLEQTERQFPTDPLLSYRDLNSNVDSRSRLRSSVTWQKDSWGATLFANRIGSFPVWDPVSAEAIGRGDRIAPYITWNTTVSKQLTDDLGVRLVVSNIFDKIAPNDPTNNLWPYFGYYGAPYSPVGREVGVEVNYRF